MKGFSSIAMALIVGALLPRPAAAQHAVALAHVTVIDGTGARPKANQTVLLAGNRIVAVGNSLQVRLPPGWAPSSPPS